MLLACELLCEFAVDPNNVARRLATIQVFCVQSAGAVSQYGKGSSSGKIDTICDGHQQRHQQQQQQTEGGEVPSQQQQEEGEGCSQLIMFTTRHNAGCALIYLDSA